MDIQAHEDRMSEMSAQELAYLAGREAGRQNKSLADNPHEKSLFDPDQLWQAWAQGRKDAVDARIRRRKQRAWNRA